MSFWDHSSNQACPDIATAKVGRGVPVGAGRDGIHRNVALPRPCLCRHCGEPAASVDPGKGAVPRRRTRKRKN